MLSRFFWRKPLVQCRLSALLVPRRHCGAARSTWTCGCGFNNFGFRDACFQCNTSRPASAGVGAVVETSAPGLVDSSSASASGSSSAAFKKGDWICACGAHNFARRQSCLVCAAQRKRPTEWPQTSPSEPSPPRAVPFRPGDWHCPRCEVHNFRSRAACMRCGVERPATTERSAAAGARSLRAAEWVCSECHTPNASAAAACHTCATPRQAAPPLAEAPSAPSHGWACGVCGFDNFASRTSCKRCHATPGQSEAPRDTFWTCACGYRNAATCRDCRECGAQLPE